MSLLTLLWLSSLAILSGIVLYAFWTKRTAAAPHFIPSDFGEFIHDALTHLSMGVFGVASTVEPHARRISTHIVRVSKWGHSKFTERVFGKTAQLPGRTASFFLKYIAENKEEVRGSAEQKAGLQK